MATAGQGRGFRLGLWSVAAAEPRTNATQLGFFEDVTARPQQVGRLAAPLQLVRIGAAPYRPAPPNVDVDRPPTPHQDEAKHERDAVPDIIAIGADERLIRPEWTDKDRDQRQVHPGEADPDHATRRHLA